VEPDCVGATLLSTLRDHVDRAAFEGSLSTNMLASGVESTKIPAGPVPARSDHSPRCGNAVCSPNTAPSAPIRVPVGTESAPVHRRPDCKVGRTFAAGRAVQETESHSPLLLLHDPNDLGTEAGSPNSASLVDRTKENAARNPGRSGPDVDSGFHPIRDWNGSYMAALAGKKNLGNDVWNEPLLKLDRGANSAE
jgi:hypothetical protein